MLPIFFYPSKIDILKTFDHINVPKLITKNTPISSMGSCFATNIGRFFIENGYNYLIKESLKQNPNRKGLNPYIAASARWDFVYNSAVMRQIIQYTFTNTWDPIVRWWNIHPNILTDPYRRGTAYPLKNADALFNIHRKASFEAISECDVFIITLGLTELWRDIRDKMVYYRVPHISIYDEKIHEFYIQTVDDILYDLDYIYTTIKNNNVSLKFIITVSPVPFNASFRKELDVISANMISKSKLRVAVDEFVSAYKDVYYFPSYEIVLMGILDPFVSDGRHIKPEAVEQIMKIFEDKIIK
jgi:hypothetical protein